MEGGRLGSSISYSGIVKGVESMTGAGALGASGVGPGAGANAGPSNRPDAICERPVTIRDATP